MNLYIYIHAANGMTKQVCIFLRRHLKNGLTELGVHIADVAHFVRPGSLTDREAAQRSTTVYLADRRHDMLPATLSANLCSLLSNVDRYRVAMAKFIRWLITFSLLIIHIAQPT